MKTTNYLKTISLILTCILLFFIGGCDNDDDSTREKESYLYVEMLNGNLSPKKLKMSADGESQSYSINSNGKWEVNMSGTDTDWLTISPASGEQSGDISITVESNKDLEDREVVLSFTVDGIERTATYSVFQLGYGARILVTPETPDAISKAGGEVTFDILTNNSDAWSYNIAEGSDWLTLKEKTETNLTLLVNKNIEETRSATVIFSLTKYPSITQEVKITQERGVLGTITLKTPAKDSSIDLASVAKVGFEWESTEINNGYKLLISTKEDLSSPYTIENIPSNSSTLTYIDLYRKVCETNVAIDNNGILYWTILPQDAEELLRENPEVRKMNVKRALRADMLDVEFSLDETAKDLSLMNLTVDKVSFNYPFSVVYNDTYKRNIVQFKPKADAYAPPIEEGSYYRINYVDARNEFEAKLNDDGHSLEALVKFDVNYATSPQVNEIKFFSTHEGGGTGLMVTKSIQTGMPNEITFLPNITETGKSTWVIVNSGIKPDGASWYHMIGVWDKDLNKAYIYINGELKKEMSVKGNYKPVTSDATRWVALGGDSGKNMIQNPFSGSLGIARIYDKPLTAMEVEYLWSKVNPDNSK